MYPVLSLSERSAPTPKMGILLPPFFVVEKEPVDSYVDENRDRHQDWAL